jgi:hypothetical protein
MMLVIGNWGTRMVVNGDLSYAGISVVTVLSAGIGAYIGAYLKKKGENLATHEDIDKLVVQIKATTEATKSIEARISNEVWDRQRKWEIKKETLFDATRGLVDLNNGLMQLRSIAEAKKTHPDIPDNVWLLQENEALKACTEAAYSLQKITLLLSVTVGTEVLTAFSKIDNILKDMSTKTSSHDFEGASALVEPMRKNMSELIAKIRSELGVD